MTTPSPKSADFVSSVERAIALKKRTGYGSRPDGTSKGMGWLGELRLPDGGVATEYTMQSDAVKDPKGQRIDFPTLVPTLTAEEVRLMVGDIIPNKKDIPETIIQKAIDHAKTRINRGQSVFAPTAQPEPSSFFRSKNI